MCAEYMLKCRCTHRPLFPVLHTSSKPELPRMSNPKMSTWSRVWDFRHSGNDSSKHAQSFHMYSVCGDNEPIPYIYFHHCCQITKKNYGKVLIITGLTSIVKQKIQRFVQYVHRMNSLN